MKWVNHIAIAGAAAAVWRPELVPVAVIGSTAPDWMEWVYTAITKRRIKHRGATHYVAMWLAWMLFGFVVWDWHGVLAAFTLGGLSHVMCDSLTVQGVPLGWWSDRRFHLFGGRLRTGQLGEYWFAGAFVVCCVGLVMLTRHWGGGHFSPFFWDWSQYYQDGLIDAYEWKTNRFKWL